MANKVNLIQVEQAIRERRLRLFSPLELQRMLRISAIAARFLVHRYAKRGVFLKLRKGLYCLAGQPPSEMVMANRLYEPSYLSFEFALSYYHLIPEAAYVVTSATSRPTRALAALGKTFEYHRLKRSAFAGYEPVKVGTEAILMATPEKALLDTLYFVDLKKKSLNDRLDLRTINWKRAESCARFFGRPTLRKLLRGLR
jgi:predicted transcriptional regulator of viral defense system